MLRQESPRTETQRDGYNPEEPSGSGNVDIQQELNVLEEMVLDSTQIPFIGKTLVDEEQLLDQLDLVRLNLPTAFQKAQEIIREKQEIISEAEEYAQQLATMAEQRAAKIMDETGIVRQAEMEAQQIRQQVQQECEALQQQTLMEIEQRRRQAIQEFEELRQQAIEERQNIQQDADEYADGVLGDVEQRLSDMLRIIRNGRQQLHIDPMPGTGEERDEEPTPRSGKSANRRSKGKGKS